ncbi:MAG: chorismate mutase [Kiritimatiellia bacterium]
MMKVEDLRTDIDGIDEKLVELLNERARKALSIGERKRQEGAPVQDVRREKEVLARIREMNNGPLSAEAIERIYREILTVCCEIQEEDGGRMTDDGGQSGR